MTGEISTNSGVNNTPIWRATAEKALRFPSLEGSATVDVLVIGGGITGITAAYLLKLEGKKVAVAEALTIGAGTTGATTAHFTQIGDMEYSKLIDNFGVEETIHVQKSLAEAITLVESIVHSNNIRCGFRRLNAYHYTEKMTEVEEINTEYEAALSVGINAYLTDSVPLPFPVSLAIKYPGQAHFHTLSYLFTLAGLIPDSNNYIFENSRIINIDGHGPYTAYTESGKIEAAKIIYATHTPLNINPVQLEMVPGRSYVTAVKLKDQDIEDALFWDNEDPYHYMCKYMHEREDYVLIGGADHKQGEDIDENEYMHSLEKWAARKFSIGSYQYRWSGQEFTPADGLPYIGRSPFADNIYIATGFSGNGISFGIVAARLLTGMLTGQQSRLEAIYSPSRFKPIAGYKTMFEENASAVMSMAFERFNIREETEGSVKPGEGKVLKLDGRNTAVYKDLHGNIYKLSPYCRHAGCMVKWNDFEKSWDCQCHGSRFSPHGDIIEGPALQGLEKLE